MNNLAKFFIVGGLFLLLLGIAMVAFGRFKIGFLGQLPGDIIIKKKNFSFYFPLMTCLILSGFFSLILYVVNKFIK